MLQEVATRLSACVSQDDTVARMGGDEFTLLLPSQGDREIALKRAIQVAELISAVWPGRSPWKAVNSSSPPASAWPCRPRTAPN